MGVENKLVIWLGCPVSEQSTVQGYPEPCPAVAGLWFRVEMRRIELLSKRITQKVDKLILMLLFFTYSYEALL